MQKFKNIFSVLGFKLTWLSCVMGEIYLNSWVGFFFGLIYLFIFFSLQNNKLKSFKIVLIFSFIGYAFDSLLSFFGFYVIKAEITFLFLPIWFLVLWFSFSCLLVNVFSFLKEKKIVSVLLGGSFGPLTYYLATRTDIEIYSNYMSYIFISIFWSSMMLFYAMNKIK